jgi:hypothetical protein
MLSLLLLQSLSIKWDLILDCCSKSTRPVAVAICLAHKWAGRFYSTRMLFKKTIGGEKYSLNDSLWWRNCFRRSIQDTGVVETGMLSDVTRLVSDELWRWLFGEVSFWWGVCSVEWVHGEAGKPRCSYQGVQVEVFKFRRRSLGIAWIAWLPFFEAVSLPTTSRWIHWRRYFSFLHLCIRTSVHFWITMGQLWS